jgi:PAS domain S-box-containing protein
MNEETAVPRVEECPNEIVYFKQSLAAVKSESVFVKTAEAPRADFNLDKSKEKFKESGKEWLRAIFDASSDGVFVENDGVIVYINDYYARLLGYDAAAELFGKAISDILPPKDERQMRKFGKAHLRGKPLPSVYEFKAKRKDGSLVEMEAAVSTSVVGGKTYLIAAARDFRGRKRAAQLVIESEQRYRLLGDSILHQVWTAQPDGKLDYVNARTLEYSGLTMEEALKEVWKDSTHPDDLAVCAERWENSLKTGESYQVEFRMRGADGDYRWHLGRATAGRDDNGKIIKWFGTNTDIHEQKLAERLSDVIERAVAYRADGDVDILLAANHHHDRIGRDAMHLRNHFKSAHTVHFDVGQNQIKFFFFENGQAFFGRTRRYALVALAQSVAQ